jgi:4'-phosphopantetheinyl transferase EntD
LLKQIENFGGSFPFFTQFDGHDGMLGVMRIADHSDALIGCEHEFFNRKQGKAAKAFAAGRRCVRALQKQLDLSEFELAPGEFGPRWPSGLVGSISHSKELVAATILRDVLNVGIDIETRGRLKSGAVDRVATREEYERYSSIPDFDWTLLFSAKESVFKAISPLVRRYIGFREVELLLDSASKSFTVTYSGNKIDKSVFEKSQVHWSIFADHVITIVTVD